LLFFLVFVRCDGFFGPQEKRDHELTREIDAAIAEGDLTIAWQRFLTQARNLYRINDVSEKLILLDKGIDVCLIGNYPDLANQLFLKAKELGALKDIEATVWGMLRKAEINFAMGKFDAMKTVLDKVTSLLDENSGEPELAALFAQQSLYAWLTHKNSAANEYIEATLFGTDEDEESRARALALLVLALMIEDQGGDSSLIELNLNASRRIFGKVSSAVEFHSYLARFLNFHIGLQLRTVDDNILEFARMTYRHPSFWLSSIAYSAQAEIFRRDGDIDEAVEILQRAQRQNLLAAEDFKRQAMQWNQVSMFFDYTSANDKRPFPVYLIILSLLMVILMLVLLLRIRTQRIVNQRLAESVEKSRIAEQAAEHANNLKSQFVANVSHEIKTPMSGLIGMTSLLEELIVDPVQRKYLSTIRTCSRNLLVLLNDLLDLGRIEANKMDIEKVPFSIEETLRYCEQVVLLNAEEKGLELLVEISPNLPEQVVGDSTRISQIIVNLLNNAIKFTTKGTVCMKADLGGAIGRNGRLIVVVEDTGTGIEPGHLRTVFEPFNQKPSSEGNDGSGSGLGLAISKRLTDHMGGSLSVISQFGKGSIFTLTLPVMLPKE
jgi:signal transduction histidine kinase